jgi:hypothetical protein
MIAYDHYNDCYKHLTDVHGGYWWVILNQSGCFIYLCSII